MIIDSSVWILFFQKKSTFNLSKYTATENIATTLPIIQEVLQGIRHQKTFEQVKEYFSSFILLGNSLTNDRFMQAVDIYRVCRSKGITIRSSIDCLIAASAIHANIPILHKDRDFNNIAKIWPLEVVSL